MVCVNSLINGLTVPPKLSTCLVLSGRRYIYKAKEVEDIIKFFKEEVIKNSKDGIITIDKFEELFNNYLL